MEQEQKDKSCPLYGTETCDRLNMAACRSCPAHEQDQAEIDRLREDVDLLYSFLPPEGVTPLFAGEACALCKGEEKGRRTCYALYDMGHGDGRARKRKLNLFRGKTYGFVVPLQFGCCSSCRRRYQLLSWLPALLLILILGAALLIVGRESVAQDLRAIWRGLPLLILLLAAAAALGVGKLLARALQAKFDRSTYMDLNDHPALKRMRSLGWEHITESRYPQPVFTRKRLDHGVCTNPLEGERAKKTPPDDEKTD